MKNINVRNLNIQEYQSKILMARYGLNVQRFKVAETASQALQVAKELGKSHCKYDFFKKFTKNFRCKRNGNQSPDSSWWKRIRYF